MYIFATFIDKKTTTNIVASITNIHALQIREMENSTTTDMLISCKNISYDYSLNYAIPKRELVKFHIVKDERVEIIIIHWDHG